MQNEKRKFNLGHLPRGSIVEVKVTWPGNNEPPKQYTVASLSQNGPDSFCFHSTTPKVYFDRHGKNIYSDDMVETFNISHVTKIVTRGTGSCTIGKGVARIHDLAFDKRNQIEKHRSQYGGCGLREQVAYLVVKYADPSQYIDVGSLYAKIHDLQILKPTGVCFQGRHFLFKVNKKKLQYAVKRLIPKFALKRAKTQREQEKEDYDYYIRDQERGLDIKFGSVRECREFIDDNGFLQCVDEENINVCSQCHWDVMKNTGQGTMCSRCRSDFDLECEVDYNDGKLV
jgi:hypothetical protein